jgi:transcriptional regulator with XRE-family HTH domain
MATAAAKILKARREELGLSQFEVAVSAGLREYDVSRYETGKTRSLPLLEAYKMAKALDLDLVELAKALDQEESDA